MSESIEKEGVLSTLVSVTSAWLGLGAGLGLLVLSFWAVIVPIYRENPADDLRANLRKTLGPDLASSDSESVQISEDGGTLKFLRTKTQSGALETVLYAYSPEEGILYRESVSAKEKQVMGKCSAITFSRKGNVLIADVKKSQTSDRLNWAVQRWPLP
jgi:hypothetical protein